MNTSAATYEGVTPAQEITRATADCRRIIHHHATTAAAAGTVPIIGADMAAEVLIATRMVSRILGRFGLTHDQIDAMDLALKMTIMQSIRRQGGVIVGRVVTGKLLTSLIAHSGTSLVTRRVVRFAPFIGTAISAGIGYIAMRAIGLDTLNECLRVLAGVDMRTP